MNNRLGYLRVIKLLHPEEWTEEQEKELQREQDREDEYFLEQCDEE